MNLSGAVSPGQVVSPSNETVTIVEDKSGFSFSSSSYAINRDTGGGTANISVVRLGNTNTIAAVNFSANTGSATPGIDYFPTNGTLFVH